MSIDTVGFSAFATVKANSMLRVTIQLRDYVNLYPLPPAAQNIYDRMRVEAQFIPSTYLACVNGDESTIVDGLIHVDTRGADIVNRMERLATLSAFVSKIELLSKGAKAESNTEDGEAARSDAKKAADAQGKKDDPFSKIGEFFSELGTIAKWVAAIVILLALAYLAREFHSRK